MTELTTFQKILGGVFCLLLIVFAMPLFIAVVAFALLAFVILWALGYPITVRSGNSIVGHIRWFKYTPTR